MKTGGAYEIIRSTDPEFLVYDHLPDLLYVPEKDSYKFEDDLSSLKEGTTVYYRVRRSETGTKWAWEERRETAVPIKVTTVLTPRSEEHTSELQSLMRISYDVFCL